MGYEYCKRWAVKRVFSRPKEVSDLSRNRFVVMEKVTVYTYSCLIAYTVNIYESAAGMKRYKA